MSNQCGHRNRCFIWIFHKVKPMKLIFDDLVEISHSLVFCMTKVACIKSYNHKGVKKYFPAFRGTLTGDDRLADIQILVPRRHLAGVTVLSPQDSLSSSVHPAQITDTRVQVIGMSAEKAMG